MVTYSCSDLSAALGQNYIATRFSRTVPIVRDDPRIALEFFPPNKLPDAWISYKGVLIFNRGFRTEEHAAISEALRTGHNMLPKDLDGLVIPFGSFQNWEPIDILIEHQIINAWYVFVRRLYEHHIEKGIPID